MFIVTLVLCGKMLHDFRVFLLILWTGMEPAHNNSTVYCKPCDSDRFIQTSHWSYQMQYCSKHWDCPGPGMSAEVLGNFRHFHHWCVVTLLIIFWQFIKVSLIILKKVCCEQSVIHHYCQILLNQLTSKFTQFIYWLHIDVVVFVAEFKAGSSKFRHTL